MFLRMQRHASRADSSAHQLLMRVPRDVEQRLKGRTVTLDLPASERDPAITVTFRLGTFAKCSLRTRDAATADMRRLAVCAHLSKVFEHARHGSVTLTQRETDALAGEVYRELCRSHHENPGEADSWEPWKALTRCALKGVLLNGEAFPEMPPIDLAVNRGGPEEGEAALVRFIFRFQEAPGQVAQDYRGSVLTAAIDALPSTDDEDYVRRALEERCGRLATWALQKHGIEVDRPSHLMLLKKIAQAAIQAGHQLKRQANGFWRPDPDADRFPTLLTVAQTTVAGSVTLPGLFDRWRAETKPAASTVTTWRVVVASLRKHLGHEDVARITASDVVAWKDALVAGTLTPRELSAKTINDTYLAGLRALLNYGMSNKLVAENVAAGVKVAAKRRAGDRKLPYDNDELSRLLALCAAETLPARRWIPLLLATSGARVGEVAQVWAERVRTIEGVPCMVLSPAEDGGTFKNEGSERTVPLHPAVIAAGFLDFVAGKGRGPLFYGRSRRRDASRHASKGTANHLAAWIRTQGFTDPRKAPNHALRHWFKTTAPRAGISDSLADAIQGHADATTAGRYRHFALADVAAAVARIPVPEARPDTERCTAQRALRD